MNQDLEYQCYSNPKSLPKEYLILQYRMILNKELFESKIINYDVFKRMQELLIKKMDKIIIENIE